MDGTVKVSLRRLTAFSSSSVLTGSRFVSLVYEPVGQSLRGYCRLHWFFAIARGGRWESNPRKMPTFTAKRIKISIN